MLKRRLALAGAACAALLTGTAATAQETVEVTIREYRFTPAEVRVKAGDTVRWVNREKRASHSVFFEAERLPESERMFFEDSWQRSFTQPGRYPYRCGPHPEMQGVVIVD